MYIQVIHKVKTMISFLQLIIHFLYSRLLLVLG